MTDLQRLDVDGMSCGACVASVERLAMGVAGV
ncbi:MAG TPA: heavy-metal-associated domain-containing protein, partial [Candidatus Poseidoniaceae archaeon]